MHAAVAGNPIKENEWTTNVLGKYERGIGRNVDLGNLWFRHENLQLLHQGAFNLKHPRLPCKLSVCVRLPSWKDVWPKPGQKTVKTIA